MRKIFLIDFSISKSFFFDFTNFLTARLHALIMTTQNLLILIEKGLDEIFETPANNEYQ
jgi:hypothetical protein